jgi:DNA helicase HerA-like ATPase
VKETDRRGCWLTIGFPNKPLFLGDSLADTNAPGWAERHPFTLSMEDRCRHMYVVGQTGTGKSTLLKNII